MVLAAIARGLAPQIENVVLTRRLHDTPAHQRYEYLSVERFANPAPAVWLKAFGTFAFAVPESGEFWKALNHPELYLPCEALWKEGEGTMCRVPSRRRCRPGSRYVR